MTELRRFVEFCERQQSPVKIDLLPARLLPDGQQYIRVLEARSRRAPFYAYEIVPLSEPTVLDYSRPALESPMLKQMGRDTSKAAQKLRVEWMAYHESRLWC